MLNSTDRPGTWKIEGGALGEPQNMILYVFTVRHSDLERLTENSHSLENLTATSHNERSNLDLK